MAFSVIYAHTAFVSLGANKVKPRMLEKAVDDDPAIVTALDRVRVENPGSGSVPEVDDPTGRTWTFIFVGAGPLSAPESTALDAIVAAHTGAETYDPSPRNGGSAGQFWSNVDGSSYAWATPPGAGGGEANTTSNAGATGTGIALAKVGTDLPFAKIDGVGGITESLVSSVLQIDGTALLPRDGSRAMTAGLDMGGFAITNVGNVDGRDISADATTWGNHIASSSVHVPALGSNGQVLTVNSGSGIAEWQTTNSVTAASTFANDNRLLRSDGASRGAQASGITVDDSNNVSGMGTLASGAITVGSGNITLTTGNIVLSQAGATVDGVDLTAQASTLSTHTGNTLIHVPALGTAGQVLTVNAGASATEWATPSGGSGGSTTYYLTANRSLTNVESDITDWTGITLEANAIYKFTMFLSYSQSLANALSPGIGHYFTNAPTVYSGFLYAMISSVSDNDKAMYADAIATGTTVSNASTTYPLFATGAFKANATPGTMKVRGVTGSTNTSTLFEGSWLTLEKLS